LLHYIIDQRLLDDVHRDEYHQFDRESISGDFAAASSDSDWATGGEAVGFGDYVAVKLELIIFPEALLYKE
jgi:hypothetical protein